MLQPDEQLKPISHQETLRGGAIYISSMTGDVILDGNLFVENYAQIQGGAISLSSKDFKEVNNQTFINNTAGINSNDTARFITDLKIKLYSNSSIRMNTTDPDIQFIQIPSGQSINWTIDMIDDHQTIMGQENQASASLMILPIKGNFNQTSLLPYFNQ